MKKQNLKRGDRIVIKPIFQLLEEGWEKIVWGWIKNRSATFYNHQEINYYDGIEKILGDNRILTVCQDDGFEEGIHCFETPYHIAREAIGMVLSRKDEVTTGATA